MTKEVTQHRKEDQSNQKEKSLPIDSKLIFILFLIWLSITMTACGETKWTTYQPETQLYAEIMGAPDFIYLAPDFNAKRIENRFLFQQHILVNERHSLLNPGAIINIRIVNSQWAEIIPERPEYNEYTHTAQRLYIPLTDELRAMIPFEFTPITMFENTRPEDKLIVVIDNGTHPEAVFFEGAQVVARVPVGLGPTPHGDFRVYRSRVSDDMPDMPAVAFSGHFTSGGYALHASPWWNWQHRGEGFYGSHGCINLPDFGWYEIFPLGQEFPGITFAHWAYLWWSSNLVPGDDGTALINSNDKNWYAGTGSVRTIVIEDIEELRQLPLTSVLDPELTGNAQVTNWSQVINAYTAVNESWILPHSTIGNGPALGIIPEGMSPAEQAGQEEDDTWVMVNCSNVAGLENPAYPGSERSVGEVCTFLHVTVSGAVCTTERVTPDFFGKKILCDQELFDKLPILFRGELIKHEEVHLLQYTGYFGELHHELGVPVFDTSVGVINPYQKSTIGIGELMAQTVGAGGVLAEDYVFVLVGKTPEGELVMLKRGANTTETWKHLHDYCGDPTGTDQELHELLVSALMGDKASYLEAEEVCELPPHELVPDRVRAVR